MIEAHEEETTQETKMQLWNAVCTTDPAHAKQVDARGGYTAISAQYQFQLATEQFGPYGKGWGVKELRYEFVDPSSKEMVLDAIFYFPGGEFEIGTDIVYRAGNDSRKKLLTDLTTKALSKLGFNADVFMGRFDDHKYVAEINAEFNPPSPPVDIAAVANECGWTLQQVCESFDPPAKSIKDIQDLDACAAFLRSNKI